MLIEEYKRSLKMPEAEEMLDLIFYRPVAFVLVKTIYRLPITPNQVTIFSLAAGLVSTWYFSVGTSAAIAWGAVWYAVANILDCSDGQLARLQHSGTLLGRVVDGVVDYISSVAIFLGLGLGLASRGESMWWLVIASGLSSAIHAIFFDHYQSEFISTVRSEKNFLTREIEQFTEEISRMNAEGRDGMKAFFLRIYLRYLDLQKRFSSKRQGQTFEPKSYREENKLMIRWWSFLGPTTNRTGLIISAFIGRIDIFLWIVLILGNMWLLFCLLKQWQVHRRLEIIHP